MFNLGYLDHDQEKLRSSDPWEVDNNPNAICSTICNLGARLIYMLISPIGKTLSKKDFPWELVTAHPSGPFPSYQRHLQVTEMGPVYTAPQGPKQSRRQGLCKLHKGEALFHIAVPVTHFFL